MKPKAMNGLMLYVTNVATSLRVYSQLGFEIIHDHPPLFGSVQLGDFLIQFQDKNNPTDPDFIVEALAEPKGCGLFVYIQVDDVDKFFEEIKKRGIVPATTPRDWPSGNREFVVRDPDGYKLVFYESEGANKSIKNAED